MLLKQNNVWTLMTEGKWCQVDMPGYWPTFDVPSVWKRLVATKKQKDILPCNLDLKLIGTLYYKPESKSMCQDDWGFGLVGHSIWISTKKNWPTWQRSVLILKIAIYVWLWVVMHWHTLVKSIVEPILHTSNLGKSLLLTYSINLQKW